MSICGTEIYRHIATRAQELGFADFGCAPAGELPAIRQEQYMAALASGHFAKMEYLGRNLEKRFNPQLLVEGARTVMSSWRHTHFPKELGHQKGLHNSPSDKITT